MSDAATRARIREADVARLVHDAWVYAAGARERMARAVSLAEFAHCVDTRRVSRLSTERMGGAAALMGEAHAAHIAALVCLLEWFRVERRDAGD